jgi:iron complex transport system substrate-binding protein
VHTSTHRPRRHRPPATDRPDLPHRPSGRRRVRRPARLVAVLAALAVLAGATGACGSGDDDGSDGADGGDSGGTAAAAGTTEPAPPSDAPAFPVEIEHTYGATTIEQAPERIVTVGLTDHDPVLALGQAPVGVTDWFGEHPYAAWPWAQELLGDAEPTIVGDTTGTNFEQVAALQPDVIIGLYAGLTEQDYETLSAIAPTVAQPGDYVDFGIPWQEQTRTVGRILGRAAEADALVQAVEDKFAAARADHPEFEGATGVVATPYQGTISVFAPQDVRGRFLDGLGFVPIDELADLAGDDFSAELSMEQTELLDADALVWILDDIEANLASLHEEPLYSRLAVVDEGREVPVANLSELGGATTFQTVLSVPVLIDGLVPMLAAAVDGDPATPVVPG